MAIKTLVNFGSAINDHTGDALRAGGIKLCAPWSKTYVATAQQFGGTTKEITITNTIAAAVTDGVSIVLVPAKYDLDNSNMLPYATASVIFNNAVRMTREGGDPGSYDVRAYGAAGDGTTDDTAACAATISAAKNAGPGGTVVFPLGTYKITVLDLSGVRGVVIKGHGFCIRDNAPFIPASTILVTGNGGGAAGNKANGGVRLFGGVGVVTTHISFQDLNIDYDTAALDALINISSANADTSGPSYLYFERCAFNGRVAGTATKCFWFGGVINWVFIRNCSWNGNWQQEIVQRAGPPGGFTSAFNGVVIENGVFNAQLTGGSYHIDVQQAQFLRIVHNNFELTGAGVQFTNGEASPALYFQGVTIDDNWFGDTALFGGGPPANTTWIKGAANGASISRNTIYGAIGSTNESGINVTTGGNVMINSNFFNYITGTAITCWANNSLIAANAISGSAATTLLAVNGSNIVVGSNDYLGTFTNSIAWNAGVPGVLLGNIPATGVSGLTAVSAMNNQRLLQPVVALTDTATIAVDASAGAYFTVTLGGNRTMGAASNPRTGQRIHFTVVQDATGGRTLNFATNYPKLTWSDAGNTLNKRSTIAAVYDGTNWNQDGAQTPYV